jgi:hypothetical protein
MEYTDYFVTKGNIDSVHSKIKKEAKKAIIMDNEGDFIPFVVLQVKDNFEKKWDWLLKVFDAEESAWGFDLYISGKNIMSATYGENAEWGINLSDNGSKGNKSEAADALKINVEDLEKCLNDRGVNKFCELVGFAHQYMFYPHEGEMQDGVFLLSEMTG